MTSSNACGASKDAGEVAAIRGAATLAGDALDAALAQVGVGMSELQIAGTLEGHLRRLGSEGHPFPARQSLRPGRARPYPMRTPANGW